MGTTLKDKMAHCTPKQVDGLLDCQDAFVENDFFLDSMSSQD